MRRIGKAAACKVVAPCEPEGSSPSLSTIQISLPIQQPSGALRDPFQLIDVPLQMSRPLLERDGRRSTFLCPRRITMRDRADLAGRCVDLCNGVHLLMRPNLDVFDKLEHF